MIFKKFNNRVIVIVYIGRCIICFITKIFSIILLTAVIQISYAESVSVNTTAYFPGYYKTANIQNGTPVTAIDQYLNNTDALTTNNITTCSGIIIEAF